jgi:predicted nucleic acid-binding protein
VAVTVFLDSSVLIAGLIDFGTQSAPAQSILHAVAERQLTAVGTAWHCCLEFFSVSTRLPAEYRLAGSDAVELVESEIFGRMAILDLPPSDRVTMLKAAAQERMTGGRIYDAHIAHVARAAGATLIVTDNRRHFLASLRYGIRVETPTEFLSTLKAGVSKGSQKPEK